mgnify:CR=1 FL=1
MHSPCSDRSMPHTRTLLLLALAFLCTGCAAPKGQLRIIHTSDIHGHFADGLTGVASIIDEARAKGDEVLLLDSGDMWSGTLISDSNEGALGVAAYNALAYDAAAIGNHEFDYGPLGPDRTGSDDPFEALKVRLKEAQFPILSANIQERKSGKIPAWENLSASLMIERAGYRIGIIGATTEETPSITFPHVGNALNFTSASDAVAKEAKALRDQGADLVVLVAHIGGQCEAFNEPDDISSCDNESELFNLIRALPKGIIDIALGGHTHQSLAHRLEGVVVAHPSAHGEEVIELLVSTRSGKLDITFAPPRKTQPEVSTNGPTRRALDSVLAAAIADQQSERDELLGARVINGMGRDTKESSPLGTFLCQVLLELHPDREICLLNSGGIRAPIPKGDMTYGHLYDVMPFGNSAATMDLNGAALLELLRLGTAGAHGVLQVGGLDVVYDPTQRDCGSYDRNGDGLIGPADRDRLVQVKGPEGKDIDPERIYRVVTNSFLASGGDSWRRVIGTLAKGSVRILEHLLPIREQVGGWLRDKRPILNSDDQPIMPTKSLRRLNAEPLGPDTGCTK